MPEITRKLATIKKIDAINPIPDADAIEVARIGGWNVVIAKKENFRVGDFCIYFEIDSFLPVRDEFEFLRKSSYKKMSDGSEGFRLKTIKLRGQISQGLVLPISVLGDDFLKEHPLNNIEPGMDVTEELGVIKYEPPIPASLAGLIKGPFPGSIVKTDEERIQNLTDKIEYFSGISFVVTEKIDGTSSTFAIIDNDFIVCSRGLNLAKTDENTYWKMAAKYNIEENLRRYCNEFGYKNLAIQGEIIGESIQSNKYKMRGQELFLFHAFDIDNQEYLDWQGLLGISDYLRIKTVPFLYKVTFTEEDIKNDFVANLLKTADGPSVLNPASMREGIVFKSEFKQENSTFGKISFKAISNNFLLKYE